jgi:hypothetical protein
MNNKFFPVLILACCSLAATKAQTIPLDPAVRTGKQARMETMVN